VIYDVRGEKRPIPNDPTDDDEDLDDMEDDLNF
jgi:hypothetical protein